ncbi:transcription factor 23 [Puntigrus tetrazona]|uniref:transcription factor 23 n=1 Tax=Puntigrus tetrazona TaxID=1606681 RepID=UPI001C8ADC4C|nr:transcription factor 23 [Puntigrus tetrazona]XP_043097899.1 transcription factor 23 [Puntigrus tetrazona]
MDTGPLGGGEGRTPSSISRETLKCSYLHTGSAVSPVVLMAERALEDAVAQEKREMGGKGARTQRWTQPCVRQTTQREPKKWVRSGPITSRACKTQNSPENAARERSRVRNLRQAFHSLQAALPSVPPDTKLSKLDVLVLATNYIAHLTETLDQGGMLGDHTILQRAEYLHPVKKWPMRSLLYCGNIGERMTGAQINQEASCPGESRLKD